MNVEKKEINYPDSNKIGKYNIRHELLNDGSARPMLQALFGLGVVLDTYENESGRGKTFIVASDLFQALAEGEEIPSYRIEFIFDGKFTNSEWESKRINSGNFGFVAIRQIIVRAPPATLSVRPGVPGQLH